MEREIVLVLVDEVAFCYKFYIEKLFVLSQKFANNLENETFVSRW